MALLITINSFLFFYNHVWVINELTQLVSFLKHRYAPTRFTYFLINFKRDEAILGISDFLAE